MVDIDDKDLAIIGIVAVFIVSIIALALIPHDLAVNIADKLTTVWGSLAGGLAGIATGRNKQ